MRRIGLDGSCLGTARWTGVERSFWHTLRAFATARPELELLLFAPRIGSDLPANVEWVPIPERRSFLWREALLPAQLSTRGVGLWLSPTAALPSRAPCACIATVHELAFRHEGAEERGLFGLRQRRALLRLGDRASLVLVPSQRTERDLARTEPSLRGRIRVVPQPLDPDLPAPPADPGGHGFVFAGKVRRRKNLPRLCAAWASLPDSLRAREPLILVGFERCAIPDVRCLPPLSSRRLWAEVSAARAVVLPSLSEGFGLPVFEGLALGRAFLASRGSVHDELLQGAVRAAGRFVDPYDVSAIAAGLRALCEDPTVPAAARSHGPAWSLRLRPESTAAAWSRCCAEALGETPPLLAGGEA